jgi:hypothetical protein
MTAIISDVGNPHQPPFLMNKFSTEIPVGEIRPEEIHGNTIPSPGRWARSICLLI